MTPDPSQPDVPADTGSIDRYRQIYDGVALPVLMIDQATWLIVAVNEAALQQYGYTRAEFVGLHALMIRPPEGRADAERVLASMPQGFWKTTGVEHVRRDGSRFRADVWSRDTVVAGRPVRIATVSDVTERVRLEGELRQAQKIEVVGHLAGGVAHDFNNALTSVIAGADLLAELTGGAPDVASELVEIRRAAHRMAALTRRLLALGRREQALDVRAVRLGPLIEAAAPPLRDRLPPSIELVLHLDPGAAPVRTDPRAIETAVSELVTNAADAMPRGGRVAIHVEARAVGSGGVEGGELVPAGDYVELRVVDTGTGMDDATLARAFEPFFSTRARPNNTGLGLATVHDIVGRCGGFLLLDSVPGQGTTCRILLPAVAAASEDDPVGK